MFQVQATFSKVGCSFLDKAKFIFTPWPVLWSGQWKIYHKKANPALKSCYSYVLNRQFENKIEFFLTNNSKYLFSDFARAFLCSCFWHWNHPTLIMVFHDGNTMDSSHCRFFMFSFTLPHVRPVFLFYKCYFKMFLGIIR